MSKITIENVNNLIFNTSQAGGSLKNFQVQKADGVSFQQVLEKNLTDLQNAWAGTSAKANSLVPKVPEEYKALFEVQRSVYQTHLQTEIITKVGDSVQSTLKKLQSQGS